MQSRWLFLPATALSLALASCTNQGGGLAGSSNPSGTGPFDSRGNYVEAWADNPAQWRKGNQQIVEAQPDRPAADVPVSPSQVVIASAPSKPETSTTVVYKKPQVTKPTQRSTEIASNANSTKPKSVVKKPVAKKPVVKAKPKSTRHTVKSGDNLYNIAKRYGTSVSAIQKANTVKGAMIRPGQTLVIPR